MLELFVIVVCLSWPVGMMKLGRAFSRWHEDRFE